MAIGFRVAHVWPMLEKEFIHMRRDRLTLALLVGARFVVHDCAGTRGTRMSPPSVVHRTDGPSSSSPRIRHTGPVWPGPLAAWTFTSGM